MKALGIMGSPRLRGNTDLLLDKALEAIKESGYEIEKIVVDRLTLSPCREYYACLRDGKCSIRDDMDEIYSKLLDSDIIIVASPIFFYGVTAQVKALIDRSQALWARKYVLKQAFPKTGRKGAFIAVGATRGENLFAGSILTIKYFFKAIGIDYAGEVLVRGIDKKGDILAHTTAMSEAYVLGRKLAGNG